MSDLRDNPKAVLFGALDRVRAGMLGVEGSGEHMQPMTHHADAGRQRLHFITSADTDLARLVPRARTAMYCVVDHDQSVHVCLRGELMQVNDPEVLDALWSPVVSAWFEGGRDDPKVTLLRFSPADAAIWASSGGMLAFGMEIARANLISGHRPDVGEHVVVQFGSPA